MANDRREQIPGGSRDVRVGLLHAKCAVADRRLLFVSSANLTDHALTLNMELGILVRGGPLPEQVLAHFEALMEAGVLLLDH